MDCVMPRPAAPKLDCAALRSFCVKGTWPRGCGLHANESAKLQAFLEAVGEQPAMKASIPAAMATVASDFMDGFERRCAGLNNATIPALASVAADEKSLADMLSAAGNWFVGLNNALVNRYSQSADPLAQKLVGAWKKA